MVTRLLPLLLAVPLGAQAQPDSLGHRGLLLASAAIAPGFMTALDQTNSYVVGDPDGTGPMAVIDPGPDLPGHVERLAALTAGRLRWILCTHSHPDHSPGAARLARLSGATVAGMPSAPVMEVLVHAPAPENPLSAAPDEASRALLASALHQAAQDDSDDAHEKLHGQVQGALRTLHERHLERRLRELRTMIGEAQRKGDDAALMQLAHQKLQVDRELRSL